MGSNLKSRVYAALDRRPYPIVETVYVSPDIIRRDDAPARKARLAQIVAAEIVPRLVALHEEVALVPETKSPSEDEIIELAHLVLSPKIQAAAEYVTILRERGLPMERLFVQLLQPAAQHLGKMWENDECDFVDVIFSLVSVSFSCCWPFLIARMNCPISPRNAAHF